MGIQGPYRVDCAQLFPFGLGVVGEVIPVPDYERSTKDRRIQAIDEESGLAMWQVDVMDFDPDARERTFKVKIAAKVQPVPPDAVAGLPVRPVYLENLSVTCYRKEVGKERTTVGFSAKATGLAPARRAGDRTDKAS